jgi:diguanylate cyclase (GGDEF)-like protein
MKGFVLQPDGRGAHPRARDLSEEAMVAAQPLLDALPLPALWIRKDHKVLWRNAFAHARYGSGSAPCHRLTHHFDTPCPRHGEPCPLERARRLHRPVSVAHVHEGCRGHGFYKVTALPVEDDAVLELHWPLDEVVVRDALTGVHTRRFFEQMARHELDLLKRMGQPFSLVLVDVDRLKQLNDRHGHAAGDSALRAVGQALIASARASDVLGRLGGDEFCLFLPATRGGQAATLARRLRTAVRSAQVPVLAACERLSVSIGIHGSTRRYDLEAALAAADRALYRAKAAGRDRIVLA